MVLATFGEIGLVAAGTLELAPVEALISDYRAQLDPGTAPPSSGGAVSGGWPKILSNLKSLLETGEVALTETDHSHAR